ncbi:uncharacterized protein LOC143276092 isoform X2 [Babylonia areolata]
MTAITMDLSGLEDVKFGEDIRQKEFCLRLQSCFLNNGSYGTVPKRILDFQKRYLDEMESHPDHWMRRVIYHEWKEARQAVAGFVGADVEDLVFVVNATSGVNCVLKSLKLKAGEAILGTSLTYCSIQQLWKAMGENSGVQALLMEVKLPVISEDALVQQYDEFLTQHPQVKFVLLDHITSPSAIVMPVKRLAALCHQHGAMVMVDGAHAPGQLPLNIKELDVDFYTGNLHKWLYTPRGCALLWVRREYHGAISPLVTSVNRVKSLSEQFFNQGTRDHTPYLCARHALHFYQAIGGMNKVVGYTSDLASQGCELLIKEAGLIPLDIPASMEAPNLRLLKLPGKLPVCSAEEKVNQAWLLEQRVYEEHDVQVVFDWVDGEMYLRISTQVHNTLDDFHRLVPIMRRFCDEGVPYSV